MQQTIKMGRWLALAFSLLVALVVLVACPAQVEAIARDDLSVQQSQQQSGDYNNLGK